MEVGDRSHRAQKSYQCEKCPQPFGYFSRFKLHQRRHNERTLVCARVAKASSRPRTSMCISGFTRQEKLFRCYQCARAFSHRTSCWLRRGSTGREALCVRSGREKRPPVMHLPPAPEAAPENCPHLGPPHQKLPPWCAPLYQNRWALAPAAGAQSQSRSLSLVSRCEWWLLALVTPEHFFTSPSSCGVIGAAVAACTH
ncbi:hypothetical protein QTO34_008525 [Cnephaeus nilssonii]|uniref:C2H2-type domain-containing protein n=1 Tax=Cnephaeus nilssonii TaxID=3371016 RepID=A0AA40IBB4_CNENI|nr:hypothetical protein QTO34_008525 [Eptesicus nilssonii]